MTSWYCVAWLKYTSGARRKIRARRAKELARAYIGRMTIGAGKTSAQIRREVNEALAVKAR